MATNKAWTYGALSAAALALIGTAVVTGSDWNKGDSAKAPAAAEKAANVDAAPQSVQASTAKAEAQAPAAGGTERPTNMASKVIGFPVIASGGETVGQVLSYGPGPNTKNLVYTVKVTEDFGPAGTEIQIPEHQSVVQDRAVQLMITKDDVQRLQKS